MDSPPLERADQLLDRARVSDPELFLGLRFDAPFFKILEG
jgi:hypothetical protein